MQLGTKIVSVVGTTDNLRGMVSFHRISTRAKRLAFLIKCIIPHLQRIEKICRLLFCDMKKKDVQHKKKDLKKKKKTFHLWEKSITKLKGSICLVQ